MDLALQAHLSLHREVDEEAPEEKRRGLEEFHSGHAVELC